MEVPTLTQVAPTPPNRVSDENEEHKQSIPEDTSSSDSGSLVLIQEKSKGVLEMERLASRLTPTRLALIYGFFALLAYCLSLNQYTSGTYLNEAVSKSFQAHALQSTINTITSVFQAMSQPPIAKFADVFGRINAYIALVVFYVVGYIVVASSTGIVMYAVGNSIYILGITGLFLLQNIIISDISSLRNRYFWTIFPSIPGAINVWVSGDITQSLLSSGGTDAWRWGFGMFVILTPVLALPITLTLWYGIRRSREEKAEYTATKSQQSIPIKVHLLSFFWQLDFTGLLLFVAGFGMFFVTITLANSKTSQWSDAHCISLLTIGGLTIIAFGLYERLYAPHPLIPFKLLKNKTVIGCLLIALIHPMAGRIVGQYLYTFFYVAAGQSVKSATRLTSIPSFAATIIAIFGAVLTRYTRRLKPIIVGGLAIQCLAFGLMIRFRTSTNSLAELVVVQILKGFGIGGISFPVQAVIQSACQHEYLGAITAAYLIVFYLSSGIGASIGGGIWTNILPGKIDQYMGNSTLATMAYSNPLGFAAQWPMGSEPRLAVARAQDEAQRIIVIVGTCICFVGLLVAIFLIPNTRLPDTQSLEEVEQAKDELAETRRIAQNKQLGRVD